MDVLAERLDLRLRKWEPNTVAEVRKRVTEIIDLADHDVLDIMQSRVVEQEVLSLLDEPQPGEIWLADLGLAAKTRPVVVVSRYDTNSPSSYDHLCTFNNPVQAK